MLDHRGPTVSPKVTDQISGSLKTGSSVQMHTSTEINTLDSLMCTPEYNPGIAPVAKTTTQDEVDKIT